MWGRRKTSQAEEAAWARAWRREVWGFLAGSVATEVVSLGGQHLCLLSHLGGPGVAVLGAESQRKWGSSSKCRRLVLRERG